MSISPDTVFPYNCLDQGDRPAICWGLCSRRGGETRELIGLLQSCRSRRSAEGQLRALAHGLVMLEA